MLFFLPCARPSGLLSPALHPQSCCCLEICGDPGDGCGWSTWNQDLEPSENQPSGPEGIQIRGIRIRIPDTLVGRHKPQSGDWNRSSWGLRVAPPTAAYLQTWDGVSRRQPVLNLSSGIFSETQLRARICCSGTGSPVPEPQGREIRDVSIRGQNGTDPLGTTTAPLITALALALALSSSTQRVQ